MILKVCPETLCGIAQFSQHEADGGEAEEGERLAVEAFPIFGQSAAAAEPGEGAFDDPALGQDDEGLGLIRPLDDLDRHARQSSSDGGLKLRSSISAVGKEFSQERKKAPNKVAISAAPPSRSWMSAAWTIACINRPCVSTRMWRFLPMIFLPAS